MEYHLKMSSLVLPKKVENNVEIENAAALAKSIQKINDMF